MPERITALAGHGAVPAGTAVPVLEERPVAGGWLLAGWDPAIDEQARGAARALGLGGAPAPGRAGATGTALLARIAPWRYLLVTRDPGEVVALGAALDPACCIECRCARSWLRLYGEGSRSLLDRETAIDLRPGVFCEGQVAQGRIGRIDALLHAAGDGAIDLLPPRSFAASLAEWLADAAALGGSALAVRPAD